MAITYSISGGADAAKFNIDGTSGKLTFKAAPDFEQPGDANRDNVYEVQVKATDAGGAASTQDLRVTVKDISENLPPQITSAAAVSVNENQTAVVTVTATDPDDGGVTPPPSGDDIPLRWNDPMFSNMEELTVGGGYMTLKQDQVVSRKSITSNSADAIFAMNQVGRGQITYCRIKNKVGNNGDIIVQASDGQSYIDHCYFDNNAPTNPDQTHVDGIQLQSLLSGRGGAGLVDISNSTIIIGGQTVTAGFFCADGWHGRLNFTNCIFQVWTQYGTRLHSDSTGDVDAYFNNVYFDVRGGNACYMSSYGGKNLNIRQWTNVRHCTLDTASGAMTLGSVIPQPASPVSTSGIIIP